MKTFKQFFEDNDLGTVDIIARPEKGQPTNLGQTDNTGVKKIANYVNKFNQQGDSAITQLVSDSEFDNKDYQRNFLAILGEYDVDWTAFKNHVDNRFTTNKLEDKFAGKYGEFNLKEYALETIQTFIKDDPGRFFEEVFEMAYAIRGTAVGGGEFVLGIIGNGKKGEKGDVDIAAGHLTAGTTVLEIGTQEKIIGSSTREAGGAAGFANQLYRIALAPTIADANPEYDPDIDDPDPDLENVKEAKYPDVIKDEQYRVQELKKILSAVNTLNVSDINFIIGLLTNQELKRQQINLGTGKFLKKDIGLSTQTGSTYNRIIGAIVMYDYMMNHADDIIVSINAGTSAQKQFPMYHTRYARIGQGGMGLKETVNLMKDKGWYNFKIQPAATKFTLGATK